jgi:hypothetical protein
MKGSSSMLSSSTSLSLLSLSLLSFLFLFKHLGGQAPQDPHETSEASGMGGVLSLT